MYTVCPAQVHFNDLRPVDGIEIDLDWHELQCYQSFITAPRSMDLLYDYFSCYISTLLLLEQLPRQ